MKITGVETFLVTLPVRRQHTWAGNYSPIGHEYVVIKLHVEGGVTGFGEAQTLRDWGGEFGSKYGEIPRTTTQIIEDHLFPLIEGEDVRRFEYLHGKMDKFVKGYPYAKAALDLAMHDAAGKIAGVPVYQLLGGLVRERIPVAHSIGLMKPEDAVREAKQVFDEGVTCVKVKTGLDGTKDIDLVRKIRKAVPKMRIRVDANQGYKTWKEALQVTRAMAEFDIWFMEQPVEGLEAMARVAQNTDVPVMADEGAWNAHDVLRIIRHDAAEMISCYYTKAGGFLKSKKLLHIAETGGLQCDVNGSAEMGIGNAANVHLAASSEVVCIPGSIPVTQTAESKRTKIAGHKYLDDIITHPFGFEDGHVIVPDIPGLGVELDDKKLEKYAVK